MENDKKNVEAVELRSFSDGTPLVVNEAGDSLWINCSGDLCGRFSVPACVLEEFLKRNGWSKSS